MHLLIFGLGYTARRLADRLTPLGWTITATSRHSAGTYAIGDPAVAAALDRATHVLSSVPPNASGDPVLLAHADRIAHAPARWIGYLSSIGVYGDVQGAWIDESASLTGNRRERIAADREWQAVRSDTWIFRLPGIYGPGRSAVDTVRAATAHRVNSDQRFSRIHVDDIVAALLASFVCNERGIYNLADDVPARGRDVVEFACELLGSPPPPLISPHSALLSPMARGFYSASRLVTAAKAKRVLGFTSRYSSYREGLRACL